MIKIYPERSRLEFALKIFIDGKKKLFLTLKILINYLFKGGKCASELAGVHTGQPQVANRNIRQRQRQSEG